MFFIKRLQEPSTWRGIIMVASAVGININPELMDSIVASGMALAGLVGVITADKKDEE